jgi:8-oxo-dGTP pyrophosphatase MutT (NUDIX family)
MAKHMVRVASYVIPVKDGQVFLMRRYKTGWMDGYYGLASGHMEAGESPTVAATREAKEEAGIDAKPEDLELALVMHRKPANEADFEYIDFFSLQKNGMASRASWNPTSATKPAGFQWMLCPKTSCLTLQPRSRT